MNINEQYTTFEQGLRLKEAGFSFQNGMMFWLSHPLIGDGPSMWQYYLCLNTDADPGEVGTVAFELSQAPPKDCDPNESIEDVPAFSVAELGKMIPDFIDAYQWVDPESGGKYGYFVNGEMITYDTEAECRCEVLLGLIEHTSFTAEEALARLNHE